MPSDTSHEVVFAPEAENDLVLLYEYIRDHRGDPTVAIGYVRRIRSYCDSLVSFPERGTRRDDLAPGLRTVGFERRATIVFAVRGNLVQILRIYHRGRDVHPSSS